MPCAVYGWVRIPSSSINDGASEEWATHRVVHSEGVSRSVVNPRTPEGLSTPLWCGQEGCPHGWRASILWRVDPGRTVLAFHPRINRYAVRTRAPSCGKLLYVQQRSSLHARGHHWNSFQDKSKTYRAERLRSAAHLRDAIASWRKRVRQGRGSRFVQAWASAAAATDVPADQKGLHGCNTSPCYCPSKSLCSSDPRP